MEKVFIKPTAHEIIIKGTAADGHMDIFSYDPDNQSQRLGHLYVIGHVQHETDDMTYAINLISALAKREYYSKDNATARDAFSVTLKKVNEVVEEFFEHKGVKINIGVFAVAGEQMYISKLGKFKVLLARGDKTIDVLNNIMFDKEKVEEKQFSSIISGAVHHNDRILAYYPSRAITAREKSLKANLVKYDQIEFTEQLKSIKKDKTDFGCAMVYLHLDKVTEVATALRIEPHELSKANLAAASDPVEPEEEISETPPTSMPTPTQQNPVRPRHDTAPVQSETKHIVTTSNRYVETHNEVPKIIPTEYSVGKKDNVLTAAFQRIRLSHLTPKHKAILSLSAVVLIVGVTFSVQYVFGINPEARETSSSLKTAQEKLDLAKVKMSQHEDLEARAILTASLASLADSNDSKVFGVRNELQQTLDSLDRAEDAVTSLVISIPADVGKVTLLHAGKELFAYAKSEAEGMGKLLTINGDSISKTRVVENTRPDYITLSTKGTPVLVDLTNQKTVAIKDAGPEIATFTLPQPFGSSYIYEDNLYVITSTNLYKFADVFKGNIQPTTWLKKDVQVASDPELMTIDGTIYVLNPQGVIAVYFRGEKSNEFATGLVVTNDHLLLSNADGPSLYLVDKKVGRIHSLDKKTGTLVKTYKIGSQEPIITGAVGTDNTLYFVTNDNKIWKIAP